MTPPSASPPSDALDELVHQFADPFSFLRELVQNALDAGSAEVEVDVEHEPGRGGGPGAMIVRVDDWGEGMDRRIIETRLTRLFSSAKDGDRTKIGKFGIGFVSVFAIEPDAVIIDTSREGEHWRIVFHRDRSFTVLARDRPVEGTKVRIVKTATVQEARDFAARAEETLRFWCRHTRGEVRFRGRPIHEPLDLPHPLRTIHDGGDERIVVAHPPGRRSFFGFYNQGLTLLEGTDEHVRGIAFKVSSPRLEHTLTRDAVIQDGEFVAVMGRVRGAIHGPLCAHVFERIERHLRGEETGVTAEELWDALAWHLDHTRPLPAGVEKRACLPAVGGRGVSLAECRAQLRRGLVGSALWWVGEDGPLGRAAAADGRIVLVLAEGSRVRHVAWQVASEGLEPAAARGQARLRAVADHHCVSEAPDAAAADAALPLCRAVADLLEGAGRRCAGVVARRLAFPGSPVGDRVAVAEDDPGTLAELAAVHRLEGGVLRGRRVLAVNLDHPTVAVLVALARREPELAAYQLVKLFSIGAAPDLDRDDRLARAAWASREARS
jgi:hypothetical protein